MLLSFERPIVGAFAVGIPRAMLLHLNGLVQAVLPESVRTCANGQLGFPRNLGSPGDNAPHDTDCLGDADRPMVCAEALLKLAHWCRQRRESASGGELCPTSRKTECPPALVGGGNVCGTGATLDSPVTDHASERPSSTEPSRRSATTDAQDGSGGGS